MAVQCINPVMTKLATGPVFPFSSETSFERF